MVEAYRARSTSTNTLPNTALERRRGKRGVPLSLSIRAVRKDRVGARCAFRVRFSPNLGRDGPSQPTTTSLRGISPAFAHARLPATSVDYCLGLQARWGAVL